MKRADAPCRHAQDPKIFCRDGRHGFLDFARLYLHRRTRQPHTIKHLRIAQQRAVALSLNRADDLADSLLNRPLTVSVSLQKAREERLVIMIGGFDDFDFHPYSPILD